MIWDSINEHLQQLDVPNFGVFDNFKEQEEIIFQVEHSISQGKI